MKLRLILFGLMLLGWPLFWLFDLPHFGYFLSFLLLIIVLQSLYFLFKTRQKVWWMQILFFLLATLVSLFVAFQ